MIGMLCSHCSYLDLFCYLVTYLNTNPVSLVRALSGRKRGDLSEAGRIRRKSHKAFES